MISALPPSLPPSLPAIETMCVPGGRARSGVQRHGLYPLGFAECAEARTGVQRHGVYPGGSTTLASAPFPETGVFAPRSPFYNNG